MPILSLQQTQYLMLSYQQLTTLLHDLKKSSMPMVIAAAINNTHYVIYDDEVRSKIMAVLREAKTKVTNELKDHGIAV